MIFAFGHFELDEERRELRRAGAVVPLEPKPFALLRHLVRHRERVVSQRELREACRRRGGGVVARRRRPERAKGARRHRAAGLRADPAAARLGFVAPVEERIVETPHGASAGAGGHVRLAGRGGALAKLERALADASAGRGRIVLLSGKVGTGKTRTAEQLAERATKASAPVLASWSPAARSGVVCGPWRPILRSLVDLVDDATLSGRFPAASVELAGLVPELRARVRGLPDPGEGWRDVPRFRLFDAVASSCARQAATDLSL